jgi:glycosyltransferase involved in cell wall biosynthesis
MNIPKVVVQTCASRDKLTPQMVKAMRTWEDMNPEWGYELFDNDECVGFIAQHFNTDTLKAFNNLIPGAFKADLFRYCYLYINGGVYSDIDNICLVPLNDFLRDNDTFVSVKDRMISGQNLIYNAFIAVEKNHPALKKAIDLTVHNAVNSLYPNSGNIWIDILDVSGPKCLATALDSCKGIKFRLLDIIDEGPDDPKGITHIKTNSGKVVIKVKYDGYKIEDEYWSLFKNKQIYNNKTPLISCLCVTKNEFVKSAIDYFHKQTYKNKELILVTETSNKNISYLKEVAASNDNIRLIETKDDITLGDLRNISVEEASGEYIIQWDDDDIYHDQRIQIMYNALSFNSNKEACFLRTFMISNKITDEFAESKYWGGVEGSIIALKSAMPKYESLTKGEDTPIRDYFLKNNKALMINKPLMYTYVIHGDNTWDYDHLTDLMLPLISCLCPTKNKPSMVKNAVDRFKSQTYINKELILVTDEKNPYIKDLEAFVGENIKLILAPHGVNIGALRKISVENASGEYIATWDDDDIHHKDRLRIQYEAITSSNKKACFLKRLLIHDTITGDKGISKDWHGVEGSMLALKSDVPEYDVRMRIAEDGPSKRYFVAYDRAVVIDEPQLLIYRYHEDNTCNRANLLHMIDTII